MANNNFERICEFANTKLANTEFLPKYYLFLYPLLLYLTKYPSSCLIRIAFLSFFPSFVQFVHSSQVSVFRLSFLSIFL